MSLRILQVSTSDVAGGAERSAKNLAAAYRERGHESWLAVGHRREDGRETFQIPNDERRNAAVRAIDRARRTPDALVHRIRGLGRATAALRLAAEPLRTLHRRAGREDFDFPGTSELLDLTPARPDILHLHNLHGGYFDLRELPRLSREIPTVLNLRDAWLLSGHCAFSLGCDRWRTGCGSCPDLTLFPSIPRDATAFNWNRKREIFASSRVYVTTPSAWMMSLVQDSIVAPAAIETRVIPNGVDLTVFHPHGRTEARTRLGVAADTPLLLVAANGLRYNVWKDYVTLRSALDILGAGTRPTRLVVLAVGEEARAETIGSVELRFLPFQRNSDQLADYYRAADIYLHAARVESFGNVLLEARACGTPVVATSVGGIPEQIRHRETGMLVPPADPQAFAEAVETLLGDRTLRERIAEGGLRQVRDELSLDLQADRFLEWYSEILARETLHAAR